MKKGQITLFIIIGVVIALSAVFLLQMRSVDNLQSVKDVIDTKPIKLYTENCIHKTVANGLTIAGLDNLENYIEQNLPKCTAGFSAFKNLDITEGNIKSEVGLSKDKLSVIAKVDYDVRIKQKKEIARLEPVTVTFPLELKTKLFNTDYKTNTEITLKASDEKAKLDIPKLTTVSLIDDTPVDDISVHIIDKYNAKNNVIGHIVYDFLPNDATFSPAVKLTLKYDEETIPAGVSEDNLRISYYNPELDIWEAINNCIIDKDKNTITAMITHFTNYAVTNVSDDEEINATPKEKKGNGKVITGIQWDFSSHKRMAKGSDNWPITWADDDNQYTAWGDGWGFAQSGGKRSLGVSKVSGSSGSYTGNDLWGGYGKSYGVISISGTLYMWVSPGSGTAGCKESRLYTSTNKGASWSKSSWSFPYGFINPTFIQMGKDNSLAFDGYVYMYANNMKDCGDLKIQKPGEITLMRAPKGSLGDRNAYEFYAGMNGDTPIWTHDIGARKPVIKTSKGVGWNCAAIYYPPIKRFLLMTEHSQSFKGNLAVFEAATPWGPWYEVATYSNFGGYGTTFFWNIAPKWINGYDFTLVFTGTGDADSWNTVNGKLVVDGSAINDIPGSIDPGAGSAGGSSDGSADGSSSGTSSDGSTDGSSSDGSSGTADDGGSSGSSTSGNTCGVDQALYDFRLSQGTDCCKIGGQDFFDMCTGSLGNLEK